MAVGALSDTEQQARLSAPWPDAGALRLLAPTILFYLACFAVPMLCLFVLSFWRAKGFVLIPDFTFENFAKIAGSKLHHTLLIRTVTLGFVTALIVVPIAFALAYLMRFVFERRAVILLQLVMLSLFSGYLVRIYAWRTILGKQGLLNGMLQWLGVIDEPLEFLIYSNFAVVVTLTGLLLPLAVLPIYSSLSNVPHDLVEVARDLGATQSQTIRMILLPMAMPGVRAAFAFTFFLAAGDFVTPALVGGSQSLMIGNVVADQFRGVGANWPLGAALAFVTMAVVILVYLAAMRLLRRATTW